MNSSHIANLCQRFRRKRVIVVGDIMLDHYVNGEVRRISPEAPVPIIDFHHESYLPGGAANVALNLAVLGARVDLCGVIGNDPASQILRRVISAGNIRSRGVITDSSRPTTLKTRLIASHQQIMRIDREERRQLASNIKQNMLLSMRHMIKGASAIVVADYAKGVIDQETLSAILAIGRRAQVPVCIDPKPLRPLQFRGCALLTPNRKEAFELAGMPDDSVGLKPSVHRGLRRATTRIQKLYAPEILLITLGEAGMLLVEKGSKPQHLPTMARAVYDVSGAGDTVIATFVIARAAGASAIEAANLANLAAGVVVGKLGAATVSPKELLDWADNQAKIQSTPGQTPVAVRGPTGRS